MVSVVVGGAAAAFTCAATLGRTSATTNTAFACCSSSSSKGGGGFLGKCSLGKFPPSGRGQRTTTFGVSVSVSSSSRRRTRGRRKRVTIKNEIRTTDGNSKAARVLGLSLAEAKDERKLKRAYRRHALRTHPDTGGKSASAEAFQEVQKAYRTLRLEIASPDNEALTKEMSKDEEWEEHDWRWKVKYDKEKALDRNVNAKSQRKREEAFRRVEEMKRMAKMKEEFDPAAMASNTAKAGAGGEGNLFPSRANKKKKRVIKPISKQSSPMENFQKVQEAEKERLKIEAEAKEKRINFKAFGGPDASKSSTNAAHDTLNAQLEGLRRKHVLKTRYDNHTSTPSEVEREKAKSIRKYQLELEDSEEERFMRLARVAKEWRDKKGGAKSWRETGSMSEDDKMTPRELLLAAVESVSLGGSQ
jgi:curved DNA-binding protein CbpA